MSRLRGPAMDFDAAAAYLNSFVNYEKKSPNHYTASFKLERIQSFLAQIGDPQDSFKSIHIAGTKGKGSTCAFCAYILRAAGMRVGLYTSPHFTDVRERIRIVEPDCRDGSGDFEGMITREDFAGLVFRLKPSIDSFCAGSRYGPLSFFEIYTAAAFVYFKQRGVDCAVLETGLGGRLDATNVVSPVACCISSISRDHVQMLGKTLGDIAGEKAGIIKRSPGCFGVVSAPQKKAAAEAIRRKCRRERMRLFTMGTDVRIGAYRKASDRQFFDVTGRLGAFRGVSVSMLGRHQAVNAACAAGTCLVASPGLRRPVDADAVAAGLSAAVWPGRFEIRGECILDGAHNGDSAKALARTLKDFFPGRSFVVILGVSRDKELRPICRQLLSVTRDFIATRADHPRAFSAETIAACLSSLDPAARIRVSGSIPEAFTLASPVCRGSICCVTGSLFVVGEARRLLERNGYGV